MKNAKRYFEKKLAENIKTDPKSYAYTRSKTRTKDSIETLADFMGEVITDSFEAANLLNDNFALVYTDEDMGNLPDPVNMFTKTLEESLQNIEFTTAVVQEKLSKI